MTSFQNCAVATLTLFALACAPEAEEEDPKPNIPEETTPEEPAPDWVFPERFVVQATFGYDPDTDMLVPTRYGSNDEAIRIEVYAVEADFDGTASDTEHYCLTTLYTTGAMPAGSSETPPGTVFGVDMTDLELDDGCAGRLNPDVWGDFGGILAAMDWSFFINPSLDSRVIDNMRAQGMHESIVESMMGGAVVGTVTESTTGDRRVHTEVISHGLKVDEDFSVVFERGQAVRMRAETIAPEDVLRRGRYRIEVFLSLTDMVMHF